MSRHALGLGLLCELSLQPRPGSRVDALGNPGVLTIRSELIRQNFGCVMCGRRGAVLNMPGIEHESKSFRAFPIERPVSIGGHPSEPGVVPRAGRALFGRVRGQASGLVAVLAV
jgi:hypothetical protein